MSVRCDNQSGFTLTEIIMVMLLLGVIASIATPRFLSSLHQFRAESGAARLMNDLNMVRRRATILGKAVEVIFNPGTQSYSIPHVSSINSSAQIFQVDLSAAPYHANLTTVSFPGGTGGDLQVVFDHYGHPDSGGSVIVSCGATSKTVALNADTGEATIP